ncbi:MAG TPA: YsnF/AvaK domain-containing protein [Geminicoccaceae bacterium]
MDTTTVIGVLDDEAAAGLAMSSLREAGFGELEVLKGGEAEIVAEVKGRDFGDEQARAFAKAAAAGKVLLAVSTSEDKADRALELLRRKPAPAPAPAGGGETVQVVEEELEVGKRKVATGGVRVTSSVSEAPVEETVTLREEKVSAERRNVDRELSPEEAEAAFKGGTVEATGTSEQAEVTKQARVVGEVSIGKQTKEREETVRDTVRRTEVEVEKVEAGARKAK